MHAHSCWNLNISISEGGANCQLPAAKEVGIASWISQCGKNWHVKPKHGDGLAVRNPMRTIYLRKVLLVPGSATKTDATFEVTSDVIDCRI